MDPQEKVQHKSESFNLICIANSNSMLEKPEQLSIAWRFQSHWSMQSCIHRRMFFNKIRVNLNAQSGTRRDGDLPVLYL